MREKSARTDKAITETQALSSADAENKAGSESRSHNSSGKINDAEKKPLLKSCTGASATILRLTLRTFAALTALAALTVTCAVTAGFPDTGKYFDRSPVLYDNAGNIIYSGKSKDGYNRILSTVKDTDPLYIKMLLAAEDERFYSHFGVDPLSVLRALKSNSTAGETVSGASTIAMQVCRLLEPKERTVFAKFKEAGCALYLTLRYGREEVLNMYLTLAPFGGDTEGVTSASYTLFGHSAKSLTPAEAALLVALPRSPEKIRPDRHLKAALFYRKEVLKKAVADGVIKADILEGAAVEPLHQLRRAMPSSAFHLGQSLFGSEKEKTEIRTTIDPEVQQALLYTAEEYSRANFGKEHEDEQLAMLAVDNTTFNILGYVGSFGTKLNHTDLIRAVRSPGSSLKPFVWAMAFEQGLLHPKSVLVDSSRIYGTYKPHNYDRMFFGEVTAEKALQSSLNLPALEIMRAVGAVNFVNRLNSFKGADLTQGGIIKVKAKENGSEEEEDYIRGRIKLPENAVPTIGVILGACGISLQDLTQLYAALSCDGKIMPLNVTADEKGLYKERQCSTDGREIFSEAAARAVYDILEGVPAPVGFAAQRERKISYKTGTSFKYRDAVSVGSEGNITLAVWTGRADNRPSSLPYSAYVKTAGLLYKTLSLLKIMPKEKAALRFDPVLSDIPPQALSQLEIKDLGRTGLRRRAGGDGKTLPATALKFEYPSDGMTVSPGMSGQILLQITGGTAPYYIRVNDELIHNDNSFSPEHDGIYNINVTDSSGFTQRISIRVQGVRQ